MAHAKSGPRQNLAKYLLFWAAVCHCHQVVVAASSNMNRQPRQHLLLPSLLPLPETTLLFRGVLQGGPTGLYTGNEKYCTLGEMSY